MLCAHLLSLLEPRECADNTSQDRRIRLMFGPENKDYHKVSLTEVTSLGRGGSKPAAIALPVLVLDDMPGL